VWDTTGGGNRIYHRFWRFPGIARLSFFGTFVAESDEVGGLSAVCIRFCAGAMSVFTEPLLHNPLIFPTILSQIRVHRDMILATFSKSLRNSITVRFCPPFSISRYFMNSVKHVSVCIVRAQRSFEAT
jgi:hypothetical protein